MEEKYKYFIQKAQGSVPNTLMEWMKIDFLAKIRPLIIPFGIAKRHFFCCWLKKSIVLLLKSLCISRKTLRHQRDV